MIAVTGIFFLAKYCCKVLQVFFFFRMWWEGGANGDSWKVNEAAEVGLWLVVTLPITNNMFVR